MSSYWIESAKSLIDNYEKLSKNIDVDVCIVGGGLTGISTAYYLKESGLNVCILEKNKICNNTSGNTTGKITSQHGLFYKYLVDSEGKEFARNYLKANEHAIEEIERIITKENIDCDFEHQDAYVYTQTLEGVSKVKDEVETVKSLYNCNDFKCEFVEKTELKINTLGAIKFSNQAQFHPLKYVSGLLKSMENTLIYENTKVVDVKKEEDRYNVITNDGYLVNAKHIVIATNYPIINVPGYYFLKMYQGMSYTIAIKPNDKIIEGMYISNEEPIVSIRKQNDLVLISGNDHKTGAKIDLEDANNFLEDIAKKLYPNYELKYRWCTEDCVTLDKIPYIGKFSNLMPNVYVGTGYKKWGMTSSNISAQIISDMILGKQNKYEEIFKATRVEPIKNIKEVKNMLKETVHSLILNKFDNPDEMLKDVKQNEGKIVEIEGEKFGIYRSETNEIYAIKPICSHLGCELSWNNVEKTWDCPCHGSRFSYNGESIYAPGINDLKCKKW